MPGRWRVGIAIVGVTCLVSSTVITPASAPGGDLALGRPRGESITFTKGASTVTPSALPLSAPSQNQAKKPSKPTAIRVDRHSATSLRVWWGKVPGAKSYKVYRQVKGKWKVVKTTSSLSWVNKKLPKRTVQRYQVAACAGKKGRGPCSAKSSSVYATTFSSAKDKKVNVTAIKLVNFPRDELGPHDRWSFTVDLKPARWGEQKRQTAASTSLRMVSSDPSVVSVRSPDLPIPDGVGDLVAKKPGSAVITVTAHNGLSVSARVYVRDRACPVVLHDPIEGWIPSTYVTPLIRTHGAKICALTRYVMTHPAGGGTVTLDAHGQLVTIGDLRLPDWLWGAARDILTTGSAYRTELLLTDERSSVYLYLNDIPWRSEGSERAALDYTPYLYDYFGKPPTTHWSAWTETGGIVRWDAEP